jgi:hypothetical protein
MRRASSWAARMATGWPSRSTRPARSLTAAGLVPGFVPETETERALAADPVMLEGWAWGAPRRGHPEGSVGQHVADLLSQLERWGETGVRRTELRFISLVHDSLKFAVSPWMLRVGENHHAMRARRFAGAYTNDERLLVTIELHDRPYHLWRTKWIFRRSERRGLEVLNRRVQDVGLFVRFVELDGSTEGKNPEPIEWFKQQMVARGRIAATGETAPR